MSKLVARFHNVWLQAYIYGSRSYQKRQIMYVLNVSDENPLKVSFNNEQSRFVNTLSQNV